MRTAKPTLPRKSAREIAAGVAGPASLIAAERKLARLRERSDTLADQLQSVTSVWAPDENRFAVEKAARELDAERREIARQITIVRRGEHAAANKIYLAALRDALLPLRRGHGEFNIRAGLDLLFRGWAVLDEVDAELRHAGGFSAVRAHLNVEQLSIILARPLEQAGIVPPVTERKHAADWTPRVPHAITGAPEHLASKQHRVGEVE